MDIERIKYYLKQHPEGLSSKDLARILMVEQDRMRRTLCDHPNLFHPSSKNRNDTVWFLGPKPKEEPTELPPNSIFDYASRMT